MSILQLQCLQYRRKQISNTFSVITSYKATNVIIKSRHRWEDNIKMGLKREVRCEDVGWIYLAQNMVQWQIPMNLVMNL
jgi:hypothetical protein